MLAKHHGFDCTVLFSVNKNNEVDPTMKIRWEDKTATHNIRGLEYLDKADLVILFSRLISLPEGLVCQRSGGRRVKLLSPTAIAQTHGACVTLAIGPFSRLTARLPGPKLCLSPQPHRAAMNFVLQPWQLPIAIRAVGVPQDGELPHRYTCVA